MIARQLEKNIIANIDKNKAIIIIGPRQVGKTTLVKHIANILNRKTLFLNCDEIEIKNRLSVHSINRLKDIIGDNKLLIIDEAQRVRDIGLTLKLIIDNIPGIQLIATGSSALELSDSINEPLTGRKFEFYLYPFSSYELKEEYGLLEESKNLYKRLVYGFYPDIVNNPLDGRLLLNNLASGYLFKDVMAYQEIRKPDLLEDLLKALALQIGSEVSYNELSKTVRSDNETITRYINLLEKAFIIFRLKSFNKNVHTELKRSRKIYFYDNGIRNALIGNFNDIESRQDIGALWENFLVAERKKYLHYNNSYPLTYFWRTTQQQEIDYLEDSNGKLNIYEFKWSSTKRARFSATFTKNYEVESSLVVSPDNYWDFIYPTK